MLRIALSVSGIAGFSRDTTQLQFSVLSCGLTISSSPSFYEETHKLCPHVPLNDGDDNEFS